MSTPAAPAAAPAPPATSFIGNPGNINQQYGNANASEVVGALNAGTGESGVQFNFISQDPNLSVWGSNFSSAEQSWLAQFGNLLTPISPPPPPITATPFSTTGTQSTAPTSVNMQSPSPSIDPTISALLSVIPSLLPQAANTVTPSSSDSLPSAPQYIMAPSGTSAPASGPPVLAILLFLAGIGFAFWWYQKHHKKAAVNEAPE